MYTVSYIHNRHTVPDILYPKVTYRKKLSVPPSALIMLPASTTFISGNSSLHPTAPVRNPNSSLASSAVWKGGREGVKDKGIAYTNIATLYTTLPLSKTIVLVINDLFSSSPRQKISPTNDDGKACFICLKFLGKK